MSNNTSFSHILENLENIQDAFEALALLTGDSDFTEAKHISPILRQINRNLAQELELLSISLKMRKV
jgi:hypothetical protein